MLRKGKVKKLARLAETKKEKERLARLREAASRQDRARGSGSDALLQCSPTRATPRRARRAPTHAHALMPCAIAPRAAVLAAYPAFRRYARNGVAATLEGCPGADLTESDLDACCDLQRAIADSDWDEGAARLALVHPESRVLVMRSCNLEEEAPTTALSAAAAAAVDDDDDDDDWDLVPEAAEFVWPRGVLAAAPSSAMAPAASAADAPSATGEGGAGRGSGSGGKAAGTTDVTGAGAGAADAELPGFLGFVHLQFCVSDGPPLLAVLNMQIAPPAMGKGLGKFALQLLELMARQHEMELVMLYIQDGQMRTAKLTKSKGKSQDSVPSATGTPPGDAAPALEVSIDRVIDLTEGEGAISAYGCADFYGVEGFELINTPQNVLPGGCLIPVQSCA